MIIEKLNKDCSKDQAINDDELFKLINLLKTIDVKFELNNLISFQAYEVALAKGVILYPYHRLDISSFDNENKLIFNILLDCNDTTLSDKTPLTLTYFADISITTTNLFANQIFNIISIFKRRNNNEK